ncbi:MAG TPA: DNA mismatch repair endonuclease MutL [Caldithrix sp.]|nr:DNA mismatch repair endonuclease MutL [Calditrichaceae bacterium]HEM49102.1 DNA mismatch repair endonuclease MutL [Caldithrix sp.]HES60184.1 DNA mismatch repair endonuclease MutL [Caldithrix sp.]
MSDNKSKIKILPENLANKIAAGEVVERPASVVKELIENAIDADAKKIAVYIEQAGKKLIQVVDDGFGMGPDDLGLAFERHATSKIKTEKELHYIETLGFRGEALPSIASVSQVEIKSCRKGDRTGHILTLSGGKDRKLLKTAANIGTSISVKNLFFNTPARRQFLRTDSSENQKIINILKPFFFAYPNITFEVYVDNNQIFNLRESEIDERVSELFGVDQFKGLLMVNTSLAEIELRGFISRPDVVRKSRGNQYLFLNGRPIQSKSLNHAIFQGYSNLISPGEYPIFCLFLEMNPGLVDVNVHPTKMEVRFSNDRSLYYFFINTIQQTLNKEGVIPDINSIQSDSIIERSNAFKLEPREIVNELKNRNRSMARYSGAQLSLTYFENKNETKLSDEIHNDTISHDQTSGQLLEKSPIDVNFWQLHNRYIISEIKSGLVIIDQHVAHERVLFERVMRVLKEGDASYGQKLLFPQKINLNYEDFMVFKDINDILYKLGFSIKVFSGNTIIIEAMPSDVKVGRESQILLDIIDYYHNEPLKAFDHIEKVAAAYACKNAIKSGEKLNQVEMHNLVDQLFACESPFFCPHGRPVIVTIDLDELDRKFKRIS